MKSQEGMRAALERDLKLTIVDYTISPEGFLNVPTDFVPKLLRELAELYEKDTASIEIEINEHKN